MNGITFLDRTLSPLLVALLPIASGALLGAAAARAEGPAVAAPNGRVGLFYDYTHVFSDEALTAAGPPVVQEFPEEDIDQGGFGGTLTLPIGHQYGARVFLDAVFSKRHVSTRPETNARGLEMGADFFWRDPEIGELGGGPRYSWTDSETRRFDDTYHSAGAAVNGSLYVGTLLDLNVDGFYLATDVDQGEIGRVTLQENWGAAGSVRLYVGDRVALSGGGSWTRLNIEGGQRIVDRSADLAVDVLVARHPALTIGANLSIGETETDQVGFSTFGRPFFTLGVALTVAFPGADSLLDLNRRYY